MQMPVAVTVGTGVGMVVGVDVGEPVGWFVGMDVGQADGMAVGMVVGVDVDGADVGYGLGQRSSQSVLQV